MIGRAICVGAWALFSAWVLIEFVRGWRIERRRLRAAPPARPFVRDRFGRRP